MASTHKLLVALFSTALFLLHLGPNPPSVVASTVCHNVECGNGKCVASKHSAVGFVCKCDSGWLQSAVDGYTDGNDFLPCVYPNCSLNLTCSSSLSPFPAPVESPPADDDLPVLDPCRWVNCEKGSCNMKSAFSWSCDCPHGFFNIAANPAFPCFSPCVIGSDCSKLGATLSNDSSSSPLMSPSISPSRQPSTGVAAETSKNDGGSLMKRKMEVEFGLLFATALAVLLTALI